MSAKSWKCILLACAVCGMLVFVWPAADVAGQVSSRNAQTTRLMQEIDHQRRVDQQRAAAQTNQASPFPIEEEASGQFAYVILVALAGSAVGFFLVTRMRRGSRPARRYPPHYRLR